MPVARYAHVKRDGWQIRITGQQYWTRTQDVSARLGQAFQTRVPADREVLAELWLPGRRAASVSSWLAGRLDAEARLDAFAISSPGFENIGLEQAARICKRWNLPFIPFYQYGEHPADLEPDQEGWVFKTSNMVGWQKWKPVLTTDLIVLDTVDGKGKYLGLMGALVCGLSDGTIVANVSGMTDDERIDMSLTSPVGRVVEVSYQYIGAGGRLRHPRFERFRDDKAPGECTQI